MEKNIIDLYVNKKYSLRQISRVVDKDHHFVKRILIKNGVEIEYGRKSPITDSHRCNISRACKGRASWSKGRKMPKESLYKNMLAHLRFDVSLDFLCQFDDIEKLKMLNNAITDRSGRWTQDTAWYKSYILKFYHDAQFNDVYGKWVCSGYEKYKKPSIDHIVSKSKGGTNDIDNLQFLSWFENRCKNDMSQDDWNELKNNIGEYFV